jgi:hypothetical protein
MDKAFARFGNFDMLYKILDIFRASKMKHRAMKAPFPRANQLVKSAATDVRVVAFHTPDDFYAAEAQRMRHTAQRLGMKVDLTQVDCRGAWVKNASSKASFLLSERSAKTGPLLYVDVDAVFHRDPWPDLLSHDCDIAVFRQDDRLIAATILLNDTQACAELLTRWKQACDADPEIWDQVALQSILDEDRMSTSPQYKVFELPVSYCWIFDRLKNGALGTVYIEQLQASRETSKAPVRRREAAMLRRRQQRVAEISAILAEG